jgi:hypothetical protein
MMRRLILAMLLLAMPAAAQQSNIPEEKLVAARELAEAMGTAARFERNLKQLDTRMALISELRSRDQAFRTSSNTNLQRVLDEVFFPAIVARSVEVVDIFVTLHARRLTVEQMRYAADFYSTPTGQQLRNLETELNRSMSALISDWLAKAIGETITQQEEALVTRGFAVSSQPITPR